MARPKRSSRTADQIDVSASPEAAGRAASARHLPPYRGFENRNPLQFSKTQVDAKLAKNIEGVPVSLGLDTQREDYIDFVTTKLNLSREFAAANYDREVAPRIEAGLSQEVVDKLTAQTLATRPKGEDAIAYYTRVWSDLIGQGRLFIDDIEEYDYPLLKGIDNAITKLVREHGGERSDHYPPHYPAPRRAVPVHHPQQETNRAAHKRAQAAYYERLRSP